MRISVTCNKCCHTICIFVLVLKCVADSEWGSRRYMDVSLLMEQSC